MLFPLSVNRRNILSALALNQGKAQKKHVWSVPRQKIVLITSVLFFTIYYFDLHLYNSNSKEKEQFNLEMRYHAAFGSYKRNQGRGRFLRLFAFNRAAFKDVYNVR